MPTKLTLLFNFYGYIYKGKSWSKRLPLRLFQEFEVSAEVARLFAVREEIIFVKTQTGDLAARLEAEGNPLEKWKEFLDLLEQTRDAIRDEEFASVSHLLWQIEELAKYCRKDYLLIKAMRSLFNQSSALIRQQQEIDKIQNLLNPVADVALLATAIYTGIDSICPNDDTMQTNKEVRHRLEAHIRRVFNLPDRTPPTIEKQDVTIDDENAIDGDFQDV